MAHVSFDELHSNLARYLDEVCDSRAALHVTRPDARGVVLVSEDEYEAIIETLHLLKSPANAAKLAQGIAQADSRRMIEHDLPEAEPTAAAE